MNFAARHLLPLLAINLNEGGEASGSGGGDGGAGGAGGEDGSGSSGDGKGAGSSDGKSAAGAPPPAGDNAAQKAASDALAGLTKSYDSWKPTLPKDMPFDEKGFGDFRKAFIDAGLKPEQAQKLVDVFANAELGRLKAVAAQLKSEESGWEATLKADKELAGANGEKLEASVTAATRAMNKLATKEFRALLTASRLERHPEMIRIMARAGAGMAEDSTSGTRAGGKGPDKSPQQKAQQRWPNSPELHNPS